MSKTIEPVDKTTTPVHESHVAESLRLSEQAMKNVSPPVVLTMTPEQEKELSDYAVRNGVSLEQAREERVKFVARGVAWPPANTVVA